MCAAGARAARAPEPSPVRWGILLSVLWGDSSLGQQFEPSGQRWRQQCRRGELTGPTSGIAPSLVQCNLVVLPDIYAHDFLRFCQLNPKPCPLLAMSAKPGDPTLTTLGADIDIRTDLPRYRLWHDGVLTTEVSDIRDHWRDDLVSFALGCSFSFEEALLSAGLEIRNISENVNVPMYKTHQPCHPAGVFEGDLVVSMRPFTPRDAIRAIQICSRFPQVHGAPIHFGDPAALGILDLAKPDSGDPVTLKTGEVPVFWACGVTPQAALEQAQLPFAITHAPGHMLITDLNNAALATM